ncbi:MAG: hypothetical protein ACYCSO_01150 [Cuniculiplasma sp.]
MNIRGKELKLFPHEPSKVIRSKRFLNYDFGEFEKFYFPGSLETLSKRKSGRAETFIEDDNRGAIYPEEICNIDGTEFHMSLKGVGSTVDPYSLEPLNIYSIGSLSNNTQFRNEIESSGYHGNRFITGETWLRGSPYGGQGLELASIALNTSEMADPTSINGFRIAPVISIVTMEEEMQGKIRELFWYRKYGGDFVQEIRLLPSNVRLYFHASSTVGNNISSVFEIFELFDNRKTTDFMVNFMKSGLAALTAFSRTLKKEKPGIYSGLDFFDVWLDKDAVLSKDGTIYFVDLEGVERRYVMEEKVAEAVTDQFYRSLYELMYSYVRIDEERIRRFGSPIERRTQLQSIIEIAVENDKFINTEERNGKMDIIISNDLKDENLNNRFTMLNRVR